jgi:serine protease Do
MLAGDVIVTFDGASVADTKELVRRVADAPVGQAVKVVVMRDGKTVTLDVTLGRREEAEGEAVPAAAAAPEAPREEEILGMTVAPISAEMAQKLGLPDGSEGLAVVDVAETSEAYGKGLRAGDIITEAGQQRVARVKDLTDRIEEARAAGRKSLLLLIRREGDPRFLALNIAEE